MAKYKYPLFVVAILVVSAGSVWLFIQESRLLVGLAQPVSGSFTKVPSFPSPSPTASLSAPAPLSSPTTRVLTSPDVNMLAPAFSLKTISGDPVRLADYRGKVVLLNFWASWCIPCKEEMPRIQAAYEKYQEHGLVVLGINMTDLDNRGAIQTFIQDTKVTFPILLDESGTVSQEYRVLSIPTSFFVDRAGIIQRFQLGPMSDSQLQQYLNDLVR